MQLFAHSSAFGDQPRRYIFEVIEKLRERSGSLSQVCLKIVMTGLSLISRETHATSCCSIYHHGHKDPPYLKLPYLEDEVMAPLKTRPSFQEIPRISVGNHLQISIFSWNAQSNYNSDADQNNHCRRSLMNALLVTDLIVRPWPLYSATISIPA